MAEVVIPPGYGQGTMEWTHSAFDGAITVTLGIRDLGVADDPVILAQALAALMTGTGCPADDANMNVGWSFQPVYVLMTTSGGLPMSGFGGGTVAGTTVNVGDPQPAYSPLVVTKRTSLAGRRYRGRMYPPLTLGYEGNVDMNGKIEPVVLLPSLQVAWNNFWTASTGSAVIAPYLLHAPSTMSATPAPTFIQSFQVQSIVGTQRRRKARS